MDERKKRALLARIEGQLAALDRRPVDSKRHRQRIEWALRALAGMPLVDVERAHLERLEHHFSRLDGTEDMLVLKRHRRTLMRADCVLWQLHLRRVTTGKPHAA